MKNALKLTIPLIVLWLLLSGHLEFLILALGAVSIALVLWLSARMHVVDEESYPFSLLPRLSTYYWPWLVLEIVKSNIDVAKRVLGSRDAVRPMVFDATASQHSEVGKVIYANSITLTPGTVSLELKPGIIRVHALHPDIARDLTNSGMDQRVPDLGETR